MKRTIATIALLGAGLVASYGQEAELERYINTPSESCELIPDNQEYTAPDELEQRHRDLGITEMLQVGYIQPSVGDGEAKIQETIVRVNSLSDAKRLAISGKMPVFYDAINKIVIVESYFEKPAGERESTSSDRIIRRLYRENVEYRADQKRMQDFNLYIISEQGEVLDKQTIEAVYKNALNRNMNEYFMDTEHKELIDKL